MNEQEIFQAALEQDQQSRNDFLKEVCGADSQMRGRVEEFLQMHEQPGDFLVKPAMEAAARRASFTFGFAPTRSTNF